MSQPLKVPRCRHCRFWEQKQDEDGSVLGLCRRAPPSYEGWPATLPDDWCGEFLPTDELA